MTDIKQELKDAADLIDQLRADDEEDGDLSPPLSHLMLRAMARIRQLEKDVEVANDRYQRDVHGLNNEGDTIGGDPAGGYVNEIARLRQQLADRADTRLTSVGVMHIPV